MEPSPTPPAEGRPPAALPPRLRWLAWAAPAALGALAPALAVLASGHTLAWRDTARVFAPQRGLVVEALRAFRLPLWNPHEATGLPLFAQMQHGVLHPVSLLLAAAAPGAGMDAFIVAYLLLAATGAALLARRLGASSAAAALAGLAFGLSGYALSMSAVLPYLAAAATAPWAIAALASARGPGGVALGALGVASLHLAGDPQWSLVAAGMGAALAAEGGGRRGFVAAFGGVLLGTALAAIQLMPAWAWLGETVRGHMELPAEERAQWALAPWRLLELFAPGFFQGAPGVELRAPIFVQLGRTAESSSFFATYDIPFVPSVFVGAGVLALAGRGAGASRRGRLLGALAVLLLWAAMGRALGADQLLGRLPVWGQLRYAEKLVGPAALCGALLAALGADRTAPPHAGRWAGALVVGAALGGGLGLALGAGLGEGALAALGAGTAAPLARWRLAVGLYHAAASLAGLALVCQAAARWPAFARYRTVVLAALILASGVAAAPFALHAGVRGAREEAPLTRLRQGAEVPRVETPLRAAGGFGPKELDAWDRNLAVESAMGVVPYAVAGRVDQIETYVSTPPYGLVLAENALRWSWSARRRYSVTHVVMRDRVSRAEYVRVGPAVEGGRPLFAVPGLGFTVWEVPHRPWAAFAERVRPVADRDEAFRALQAAAADPGEVIVEGPPPTASFPGRVLGVERRAESIHVDAEAEGPGLLVIADAFWPGWRAGIDGRPAAIVRADLLVRAVEWPAGRHSLEMTYEPRELVLGKVLTAAAMLVALALWGIAYAGVTRRRAGQG